MPLVKLAVETLEEDDVTAVWNMRWLVEVLNEKQTVIDSEEAKPTHCSIFSSATRTRTVPDHYP